MSNSTTINLCGPESTQRRPYTFNLKISEETFSMCILATGSERYSFLSCQESSQETVEQLVYNEKQLFDIKFSQFCNKNGSFLQQKKCTIPQKSIHDLRTKRCDYRKFTLLWNLWFYVTNNWSWKQLQFEAKSCNFLKFVILQEKF